MKVIFNNGTVPDVGLGLTPMENFYSMAAWLLNIKEGEWGLIYQGFYTEIFP